MNENYEVARIIIDISRNSSAIDFHNGRGNSGLGVFNTLDKAIACISKHKSQHPSESWPYVIINYEGNQGRLVHVEYKEYKLNKEDI